MSFHETIRSLVQVCLLFTVSWSGSAAQNDSSAHPVPGNSGDTAFADTVPAADSTLPRTAADSALPVLPADTATAAAIADTAIAEDTSSFDLAPVAVEFAEGAEGRPERLYPGVTLEQHLLVRRMLDCFYDAAWDSSENIEKELMRLEKKQSLPPLSVLLAVGIRVLRVLHGEYESERQRKNLIREVDKLAEKGLDLAVPNDNPDSCRATNLLITGGLQGFTAALEIDRNPINAAINGLSSLKSFKKAVELDTMVRDAYLGVAMYHCVMSRAPSIVRGALALVGKKVSLEKGLEYMRVCAYGGSYTNEVALLLLTEFLSPYKEGDAEEKRLIFGSLQSRYPHNPFFTFLELDEDLCFHPEHLSSFSYKDRIRGQILKFATATPSAACYAALVKWQYLLIDPFPTEELAPDKEFRLRRFSYYPVFLQAAREKIVGATDTAATKTDLLRRQRFIRAMGARAERMLDASSEMPANRKGLYLWHIRDALRMEQEIKE